MGCNNTKAGPKAAQPETVKADKEPEATKEEPKVQKAAEDTGKDSKSARPQPGDSVTVAVDGGIKGTVVMCTTTDVLVKTKTCERWFDIEDVQQFSNAPPLDTEVVVGKVVTTVKGLSGTVVKRTTTEVCLKTEGGEEKWCDIEDIVVIKVTIVSASDLRNADWVTKSDPYCACQIVGRPGTVKTQTVNDNLEPTWNFEARLLGFQKDDSLKFDIFDSDLGKKDDFLGTATLESDKFRAAQFYGKVPLTDGKGNSAQGSLTVRVRLEPAPAGEEPVEDPAPQPTRRQPEVTEVEQHSSGWCC